MCGIGSCFMACIGSMCGSCAAGCCKCCAVTGSTKSRVPYLLIMFVSVIVAVVVRVWGEPITIDLYIYSTEACDSTRCLGFGAVYRISALLFLFFFLHVILMFGRGTAAVHTSWWCAKIGFLLGGFFILYLIPNDVFYVYASIARFVSAVFLVLQIVILIEFAYNWNKEWTDKESKLYNWGLIFLTLIFYTVCFILFAYSLEWYREGGDCTRNEAFIGLTLAFMLSMTILVCFVAFTGPEDEDTNASLFTTGVVSLYCFYLLVSALSSDPSTCNSINANDGESGETVQIVVSMIIAAVSVTYAGWNLSNSTNIFGITEEEEEKYTEVEMEARGASAPAADAENAEENTGDADKAFESEDPDTQAKLDDWRAKQQRFHMVMACCAMYVAMILTNWGVETSENDVNLSEETVYIKMSSQWVCIVLYSWTLIAPRLFPNRDFSG